MTPYHNKKGKKSMEEEARILSRLADMCSKSEHCTYDIKEKLRKSELDGEAQARIIERLQKDRFIDDARYAEIYARDKARFNNWGPIKIRYELRRRGIASNMCDNAIAEVDENIFDESLRKSIESKRRMTHQSDPNKLKASLLQYGCSKGFEYEQVARMVHSILNDDN